MVVWHEWKHLKKADSVNGSVSYGSDIWETRARMLRLRKPLSVRPMCVFLEQVEQMLLSSRYTCNEEVSWSVGHFLFYPLVLWFYKSVL